MRSHLPRPARARASGAYKLADPKKQRERAVPHAHVAAALGIA
jgi:hypothetical protein